MPVLFPFQWLLSDCDQTKLSRTFSHSKKKVGAPWIFHDPHQMLLCIYEYCWNALSTVNAVFFPTTTDCWLALQNNFKHIWQPLTKGIYHRLRTTFFDGKKTTKRLARHDNHHSSLTHMAVVWQQHTACVEAPIGVEYENNPSTF